MKMIKKLLMAAGAAGLVGVAGGQVIAQVDIRYTEAPKYNSQPCASGVGRELRYQKPAANADAGYKALFGVWCGLTDGGARPFLISISEDDEPFSGMNAQTVRLELQTEKGLLEWFGVAFFDTRQKRWAIAMERGETWVLWTEPGGRIGQGRGRFAGKTVRMFKGRKQTWVLMSRVR